MRSNRTRVLIGLAGVLFAASLVTTVYLAVLEIDDRQRLGSVTVVGPCREFGPDNKECRRQSRKIIRSCLTHRDCLSLIERLIDRARRQGIAPPKERGDGHSKNAIPEGGGSSSTGSAPPSQPSPPSSGGLGGNDDPDPPVGSPPATPPGPLDPVTQPVCEVTSDLGVSVPAVCP